VDELKIAQAIFNLQSLGLVVVEGKNIRKVRGQHAGTDQERLDDLHAAFADEEAAGIWAIRGGDGSSRLLGQLDYELIRKNPKVLVGFSDITALLQAIQVKTGLIGFHGPIASWPITAMNKPSIKAVLFGGETKGFVYQSSPRTTPMVPGTAEGRLAGGNLSILAALAGTPYALDARDKIVFIEDVGESPRRIDRMLTTLLDAKDGFSLRNASGIVLGEFLDCDCERDPLFSDKCLGNSMTLQETLQDRLGRLNIPIITDFPFGHEENLVTFPVGALAELDAYGNRLTLLEDLSVA
jgi:muramoyltetrapeptide carboxypeptidase